MSTTETDHEARTSRHAPSGPRRRLLVLIAVLAASTLIAALVVVVLALSDDGDQTQTASATLTTTTETEVSTTQAPVSTTTSVPTTTTATQAPTAADDLDAFFTEATTMDGQLRSAAEAINSTGPPWTTITDEVAATVEAADIGPVVAAIPAGLPRELLQPVILVTSDLSSRRAAMTTFSWAGPANPDRDLLAELSGGHAAAERFADDLAHARAAADAHPPIQAAAPDSRAAAEVAILIQYIHLANNGCDSRGGAIITTLPPIIWQTDTEGTIGDHGLGFEVTLLPNGTWQVFLNAC